MSHRIPASLAGAGAPTAVVPLFEGQIYLDTNTNTYYVSNSAASGDWSVISSGITSGLTKLFTKAKIGAVAADSIIYGMVIYNNKLYVGTYNATAATDATAAKLLCYDGSTWSTITKATMGGVNADTGLRSMCVYANKLYIGTYNTTSAIDSTGAKILIYDGASWSTITKATIGFSNADRALNAMCVYNNKLYIGTQNTTNATDGTAMQVASYDGANWVVYTKATMGGVGADTIISNMCVYDSKLYMSTGNVTAATDSTASKLIVWNDATWSIVTKATAGGVNADRFYSFAVYNSKLYVGTDNTTAATDSTGAKLCIYNGSTWSQLYKNALGAVNADTFVSFLVSHKDRLYIGWYNATSATDCSASKIIAYAEQGCEIYPKNNLSGLNGDTYYEFPLEYQDKLWLSIYNSTAAIDITGTRIINI